MSDQQTAVDEMYRAHLKQRLEASHVPESLQEGLLEYIAARRPCGHFLTAVLSNDLAEACKRADDVNRTRLYDLIFFLYNYAPGACWGSPTHVALWLADTGPAPEVYE